MDRKEEIRAEINKYLNLDLKIFPLSGKLPLKGSHGFKDATTDRAQIKQWWTDKPLSDIGLATGKVNGLILIDVDINHDKGKYGDESFRELERELGQLPDTWTCITGTGGYHYYFRYPEGYDIGSSASKLADWIDIKADGGYGVVPPSKNRTTGNFYTWEVLHDPGDIPLADLPDKWLAKLLEETDVWKTKLPNEGNDPFQLPEVIKDNRNVTLFHFACSLRVKGVSATDILDRLRKANAERCAIPLSQDEVSKIFNSALRYQAGTPLEKMRMENQIHNPQIFHFVDADGKAKGVFDYGIFDYLKQNEHLFILGKIPYLYRNGFYQQDTNGAKLKTMIRNLILPQFTRAPTIDRVYNLFLSDADLQKNTEDVNCFPDHWMNFKNGFYDPIEKKMIPHDPKYLAIYQLSCEYHPEKEYEGDQLEAWLQFICTDPDDREMLLQFCGYSLTRDRRQEKFLLLNGAGGTGKSTLISLIETMVGSENNSHVSLTKFNVKFANFALLGKVLNTCGDEDITVLKDTQVLKQVSGEDPIQVESKGKDPIDYHVYAKCIFSTNNLPVILNEDTNGFYRRILLLKMNRTPERKDPWLSEKLKKELPYFVNLCVKAAERMYANGLIMESDNSIEAVKGLRRDSDTVQAWLENECRLVKKNTYHPTPSKLYENYEAYCRENDRTALKRLHFYRSLEAKCYERAKYDGRDYFKGIELLDEFKK